MTQPELDLPRIILVGQGLDLEVGSLVQVSEGHYTIGKPRRTGKTCAFSDRLQAYAAAMSRSAVWPYDVRIPVGSNRIFIRRHFQAYTPMFPNIPSIYAGAELALRAACLGIQEFADSPIGPVEVSTQVSGVAGLRAVRLSTSREINFAALVELLQKVPGVYRAFSSHYPQEPGVVMQAGERAAARCVSIVRAYLAGAGNSVTQTLKQ
jgi:hypothetical protein